MEPTALPTRALALALGTLCGALSLAVAAAQKFERAPLANPAAEVEVFIRLATPSVAELNASSLATTGELASSAAQKEQAARVDAEQAAFRAHLGSYNARELSRQRVGANGLRVRVPAANIEALKALPGVRSVGRVEIHTLDNAESVPWIGAAEVAARLGLRGDGIRIGIIDSGIDYTHKNFGGPGTVAAYQANNKNVIEAGTFPTAKVVGGFDFAGAEYDPSSNDPDLQVPRPDPDPLDGNGHGSHVAGSAAGIGVADKIGAGVAPNAKLYALKVFNDTSGSTAVTSLAIEWAMDPNGDGDMRDHLDVLNLSLGSSFGEPDDPSAISVENATKVGMIVVTAAGNDGDLPYVTDSPGVAASAISVAANIPGGKEWATLSVGAPAAIAGDKYVEEGTSPTTVQSVAPLADTVVEAVPLNGCAPLTNGAAVAGNIVLIQRGTCLFAVKNANAFAAGARAVIMANQLPGDPFVMGGIVAEIPGVMVGKTDGDALIAAATTAADSPVRATLGFGTDTFHTDRTAAFSSRGPGGGGTRFKPDVAAPGVAIISTGVGEGDGPAPNQGTSMSSPHVAGAAALLRQKYKKLSSSAIKALLQNSTVNGQADISLARQGVGSVRVDRAAALTSYASPGGVSFGRVNPKEPTTVTRKVTVNNLAKRGRTFSVTHVPHMTYPGVTVSCPSSFSVNNRREVTLRLSFDPGVTAAAGVFDNPSISHAEVDGWCVLSDGTDSLRVGYMAAVDAASSFKAREPRSGGLNITNEGPAAGFADGFTLVGSGGRGARNTYSSIDHLGAREAELLGFPIVEFGIALDERYEHVSNLAVDLHLNTDGDSQEEVLLQARDWTLFDPVNGTLGTYVTAQFAGNAGFLDWIVGTWDFNDRVLVLPFTLTSGGGFVPSTFSYRLVVTDRQGNADEQRGRIDLTNLVVPDAPSFGIFGGTTVHVNVAGDGDMLWLFPNNVESRQATTTDDDDDDDDDDEEDDD